MNAPGCSCLPYTLAIVLALILGISLASAQPAPDVLPAEQLTPGSWVIAVIPDTQSYVDHAEYAPILDCMTQWLADNATGLNLRLVLQEGDVVFQNGITDPSQGTGDQNSEQQWHNARDSFAILDAVLPYITVPGNHDYGITNAESRQTQFNDYFLPERFTVATDHSGLLLEMGPNAFGQRTLENAAYTFAGPDGRRLLILALEWGPRQAVVDWANCVAARPEFADYTKLLLTHAYLYHDGTRYDWASKGDAQTHNPHSYSGTNADTNDGQELWDELVNRHRGFQLVLCGHVAGDMVGHLSSVNQFGERVEQMVFNAQFLPQGGQGWLRLLEFMPDGRTVRVHTYSPWFAQDGDPGTSAWRHDTENEFSFELAPVEI